MASAYVTNNTPDSMTKGKKIAVPVTVLECPTMRIFSVRFYKNNKVAKDVLTANLEKELKRKVKLPKKVAKLEDTNLESFDDVSVVVYSQVKKTGLKKSPDLVEVKVNGKNLNEKLNLIKENLSKELSILNFFEKGQVVDVRGVTKGKGFQGATKRFGLKT
jgi:large subunit ribosomal protein L3